MNDIEILEKFNSILNNAKANWIYEDYEILLNFKELYDKEKAKNKRYLKYLENKDNHYESVLEYLESEKEKDYIAKSKIKAKRDKLIEVHKERDFTNKEAYYLDCYNELLNE